jgi:ribosomal protein S18 acetylase RimI-like enzyme
MSELIVERALPADIPAWRLLAAEVEPLFGPMVGRPEFEAALARTIERGQALCVRAGAGQPGAPLLGGLLWSARPPHYEIDWLAVSAAARRRGVGRRLAEKALAWVVAPATVDVVTFGEDDPAGRPARELYLALGFRPAEEVAGPGGERRQLLRLAVPRA